MKSKKKYIYRIITAHGENCSVHNVVKVDIRDERNWEIIGSYKLKYIAEAIVRSLNASIEAQDENP
jgi:hypothetical protein